MMDPEEVFGGLFGGERFHDIIGTISIGREMKEALQKDSEELAAEADGAESGEKKDEELTPEQKEAKAAAEAVKEREKEAERERRVEMLAEKLERRLGVYVESVRTAADESHANEVRQGFREMVRLETEELKHEKYVAALTQLRRRDPECGRLHLHGQIAELLVVDRAVWHDQRLLPRGVELVPHGAGDGVYAAGRHGAEECV